MTKTNESVRCVHKTMLMHVNYNKMFSNISWSSLLAWLSFYLIIANKDSHNSWIKSWPCQKSLLHPLLGQKFDPRAFSVNWRCRKQSMLTRHSACCNGGVKQTCRNISTRRSHFTLVLQVWQTTHRIFTQVHSRWTVTWSQFTSAFLLHVSTETGNVFTLFVGCLLVLNISSANNCGCDFFIYVFLIKILFLFRPIISAYYTWYLLCVSTLSTLFKNKNKYTRQVDSKHLKRYLYNNYIKKHNQIIWIDSVSMASGY